MKKEKISKMIATTALVLAMFALSIAFAAMSTTLNIHGTAKVQPASWQIRFANLNEPTITGGASVLTAPTLTDTLIGTFSVRLTGPGDAITYTFDIVNAGTINAVLGTLTDATPTCTGTGANAVADANIVCNNLNYTLVYTDTGISVAEGDTLNAGQIRNVTLRIAFLGTELPENTVNITGLNKSLIYIQN